MTDRHHAGEDADIPGLDEIREESDPADPDAVDELLEEYHGAQAAKRDDIPTAENTGTHSKEDESRPEAVAEDTSMGRWVCRFCKTERRRPDSTVTHHATCPDSQHHRETKWNDDEPDSDATDDPEQATLTTERTTDAGGDSPGEQRTFLIDTQWHEFRAYLKFAEHGLDPYYALHSLMRRTDWDDGPPTEIIEYDGHKYEVTFTFGDSGLEPWDDPSFKIEKVREFRIHVETAAGIRKADFHIRPRWPDMESRGGMNTPSNPRDFVGLDIDAQGANHDPRVYPELLDHAMEAFGINGGANAAQDRYLSAPNVEPWSIIIDGEQCVRVHKDHSGSLFALNGPLERMNMVLAGERSGYRKRVADDQKVAGYYHTVMFDSKRARKILDGHQLAKEVKHYHVKHPENLDSDDPLRHPKLGVSYQRSKSDTPVYWDREALEFDPLADKDAIGLQDMNCELDELLLNVLQWANLPTRPDQQVFVDDAVFTVEADRRERTLVTNPLPTLEKEQEHMVTRAMTKMCDPEQYDTDALLINEVLSDGGEKSPKELAADTDKHYETILQSIERLSAIFDHSYGSVELKSQYLAQQLAERAGDLLGDFGRWREHVDRLGEKVSRFAAGAKTDGDSPFEMWAEKYLEDIEDPDDDPRLYLRMGYRPGDMDEAREISQSGLSKLRSTFGAKNADSSRLVRNGHVSMTLIDGTNADMEFAPAVT